MKNHALIKRLTIAAAFALVLVSCATTGKSGNPDEQSVTKGIEAWNKRNPEAARGYWADIGDPAVRKKFLGYIDTFKAGDAALTGVTDGERHPEAALLAACDKVLAAFSSLDERLLLPDGVRNDGAQLSEGRMRVLLAGGNTARARDLGRKSVAVYGKTEGLTLLLKEADIVSASRSRAAKAETLAQEGRSSGDFSSRLAAFDASLEAYRKAESVLAAEASSAGIASGGGVAHEQKLLRREIQNVSVERDGAIRAQAYQYKDRIGEEFARVPEKGAEGSMSLEEMLAHQESVKSNIETVHKEMLSFAGTYPESIGKDILDEIDGQKRDLDLKIAQINNEIRTAKEIASRGKVVMPIMIGLFNPAPSTGDQGKKSRPAVFSASKAKKDEYWWGMVSIPRGEMNDLVITMKDPRTVRVFGENTRSGKLIEKNKMTDMVNRTYKVGNSWPVLNAGGQLPSNKYFFEVQEGKTNEYEGEVVVYSSFIMRMR
ncbi:MAG TPA: hypothetical protein PLP41_10060 [Treponemataceae bacterium]|nr:hypothetical protein [Treponemataceae bacterium]HOS36195.1 hypothetical protein [Treponemataceae bacterium]HPL92244.1 hypothetical protein [Treponemataceae bacterium]